MKYKTLRIHTVENGWVIESNDYYEGRLGNTWVASSRDELAMIIKRLIEEPVETKADIKLEVNI